MKHVKETTAAIAGLVLVLGGLAAAQILLRRSLTNRRR